jgi:tetratricopeptide (TPR) repeat protein
MPQGGPSVKAIFNEALEHPARSDREAYLDHACGSDFALRLRVEELLAAYDRATDVLGPSDAPSTTNSNATSTAADHAALSFQPTGPLRNVAGGISPGDPGATTRPEGNGDGLARGDVIRYFGDYEIRRELGRGGMGVVYEARQVSLSRPVALKMIKAGLLAGDEELRRFENEAEAVALLDHPGIVPVYEVGEHDGQHFFSMKLVSGGSLMSLLERFTDDPLAAARLVAEVAAAVAHAHMRGILHRDLKPANILVDPEGHPHVTDFGLAKKVEADVEFTQSGAILGTPAYMSPEQATGRRGSITTATDVYGLGAVLYAVLTGRAPSVGDGVVETIEAARHRPPEPLRRLNPRVPRDLETICLKCLEKDPRRRYATAQSLADDLNAWLESRPIAARRIGAAERGWLWCKRRPAVATLSAAVLMAVVGGTSTVIVVQANANGDLRAANERVKQRYELAVDAIKTFHTGVSEDFLLKQVQFKALRGRLLKSAADFYGRLGALLREENDRASRRALAASNFELADLADKVGGKEDALRVHRAVLAVREALFSGPGADFAARVDVGRSLIAVARLLHETGQTNDAMATFRRAESLLEGLAAPDPAARAALADCRSRLGYLLSKTGQSADALSAYLQARADQEALAAAPGVSNDLRRALGDTVKRIAILFEETGRLAEAEVEKRKALEISKELADDNPGVADFRIGLAGSHHDLAWLLFQTGKHREAKSECRIALGIRQELARAYPAVTQFQSDLALSERSMGNLQNETGQSGEATHSFKREQAIWRRLATSDPTATQFQAELAASYSGIGNLQRDTGRPRDALRSYEQGIVIFQKLADTNPEVVSFQHDLAVSHHLIGWLESETNQPIEAIQSYKSAQAIWQRLVDSNPTDIRFRADLAAIHGSIGNLQRQTGQPGQALRSYEQGLAMFQSLAAANTAATRFRHDLAISHTLIGGLHSETSKPNDGLQSFERAQNILQKLADANPTVTEFQSDLGDTLNKMATIEMGQGRLGEARSRLIDAVRHQRVALRASPRNSRYRQSLSLDLSNLARTHLALRTPAEAAESARELVAVTPGDPETLYTGSCFLARCAPLAEKPSDASCYADESFTLLKQAVIAGWKNALRIATDPELAALRGRDDFKLLLMDLDFPAEPFTRPE